MREFLKDLYDLLRHRYIRTGEWVMIYNSSKNRPRVLCRAWSVGGWAVKIVEDQGTIRRDLIRKDEYGNWFYKYSDGGGE